PIGTRLPPERRLAQSLAVSRSTVVAAYEQLKSEGWLESRQGSGTWIRRPRRDWEHVLDDERLAELGRVDVLRRGAAGPAIGLTAAAVEADPLVAELAADLPGALAAVGEQHGYAPFGLDILREAIAEHLTAQGLPTGPHQVLVTTGAMQAIFLAALSYVRPGDSVVVESPGYPGALDALRAVNARVRPLPVDGDGARPDLLDDLLGRSGARLAYMVPTFHNPTGALMSPGRRREVARIVREHRVPLLEDDVLRGTELVDAPPPPIAASDPDGFVLTVGSMSKLFWAGLRVGWLRAPEHVVARLAKLKNAVDLGTPVADQLLAARLLRRADEVTARRRAGLGRRLEVLDRMLRELLPEWSYTRPEGGLSLWVRLPHGDASEFTQVAQRHGVAIVPGGVFAPDEAHGDHVRLTFVASPATLEEAVHRLADAWRAYSAGRRSSLTVSGVVV
ncbi:MAG TPA: PLP-dependent aminotransferase family protein, partial [Egibacteraceae bacterium]